MVDAATTKSFFDYAAEDGSIPENIYLFRVSGHEMREDKNGQSYLQLQTVVEEGEFAGFFGPRKSFFIPKHKSGTNRATGKPYTITVEQQKRELANEVFAIVDNDETALELSQTEEFNETLLAEIGPQLEGRLFYGKVVKNGEYNDLARRGIYPLSSPPEGADTVAAGFSVDDL